MKSLMGNGRSSGAKITNTCKNVHYCKQGTKCTLENLKYKIILLVKNFYLLYQQSDKRPSCVGYKLGLLIFCSLL